MKLAAAAGGFLPSKARAAPVAPLRSPASRPARKARRAVSEFGASAVITVDSLGGQLPACSDHVSSLEKDHIQLAQPTLAPRAALTKDRGELGQIPAPRERRIEEARLGGEHGSGLVPALEQKLVLGEGGYRHVWLENLLDIVEERHGLNPCSQEEDTTVVLEKS